MGATTAAIIGVLVGAALALAAVYLRQRGARALARRLVEEAQAQHARDIEAVLDRVRAVFGDLSQQALTRSSEQFLQLAETRLSAQTKQGETSLDARKRLIDETVQQITQRLTEVGTVLQTLEKDRRQSHGSLVQHLEQTARTTAELQATTAQLREALANPQRRGQWGERMAEDVLRLAGFIEGINYTKQTATEAGQRPDFTFPLPQGRRVNMDVKFPLYNYLQFLDAADDTTRAQARTAFLRDVRLQIRQVTGREYIDPARGTVDYVLVFIPNEQIYGFIHQNDPALLDDALRAKVVLCSPLTLYAILAVVRQAAENLRAEQASQEILALLAAFRKEWAKFTELLERLGKGLTQTMEHYEKLTGTRTRQLERQLEKIEELRSQRQLALPESDAPPELAEDSPPGLQKSARSG